MVLSLGFEFEPPRVGFIDRALGVRQLDPETIAPYYDEVMQLARPIATILQPYTTGSLDYMRELTDPVDYRTKDGRICPVALAISTGPAALWDDTVLEALQIGIIGDNQSFIQIAELRAGQIRSGTPLEPQFNRPDDLDDFMRLTRYISEKLAQ